MKNNQYSLIIRNAYLRKPDKVLDIGIVGDRIARIEATIPEKGEVEIDAGGNFVSPGLVDPHTHMDKSLTIMGERFPCYNDTSYVIDGPTSRNQSIKAGLEYYGTATPEEIKQHIIDHARMQIINGTLFTRTHVDVDPVAETKAVEAALEAKKDLRELLGLQVVAFAQSGLLGDERIEPLMRKSAEMGVDLIGGLDPATLEKNIEGALDLAFRLAREYEISLDHHIMDPSTLGIYTLQRLAAKTIENGYQGKVTCSHSWCLGDAPPEWLEERIPLFKDAALKFVTCYTTTPYNFPVRRILQAGLTLACGSDNIRDFWLVMGNGDLVEELLVETQRLNMTSNGEMDLLWEMITIEGAKVMGIEDDYGIETGKKADLVIFDEPSPQWVIIKQARKTHVIKNGKVIARDGKLL